MIEVALQHGFHFDTVQMPINVMDAQFRSFAKQVIPVAQEQGIGVLAMKTLGGRAILQSNTVSAPEALHYALSQPIFRSDRGIDSTQILDQAFAAVKDFKPMTQAETAALLARTRDAAMSGEYEPFKTTARMDGTTRVPMARVTDCPHFCPPRDSPSSTRRDIVISP